MNKVFSAGQRKDKDPATGKYVHEDQEPTPDSGDQKNGWLLALAMLLMFGSGILAVLLL